MYLSPFLLWKWVNIWNYFVVMQGKTRTSTGSSCCLLLVTCLVWKPLWHSWVLARFNSTTLVVWFCYYPTSGYLPGLPPCFHRCCTSALPFPVLRVGAEVLPALLIGSVFISLWSSTSSRTLWGSCCCSCRAAGRGTALSLHRCPWAWEAKGDVARW